MFNLEKIGRSTDQLLTETICRRPTTPLKKKERPQCTEKKINFWKLHMYYVNNFQFHKHVKCR